MYIIYHEFTTAAHDILHPLSFKFNMTYAYNNCHHIEYMTVMSIREL